MCNTWVPVFAGQRLKYGQAEEYSDSTLITSVGPVLVSIPKDRNWNAGQCGLLRFNSKWLFSHELLLKFLVRFKQILSPSFSSFWKAILADWKSDGVQLSPKEWLTYGYLYPTFLHAVIDYIILRDVNYDDELCCKACLEERNLQGDQGIIVDGTALGVTSQALMAVHPWKTWLPREGSPADDASAPQTPSTTSPESATAATPPPHQRHREEVAPATEAGI